MLRLARLHRATVGIPGTNIDARALITVPFSARRAVSSIRLVHSTHVRHAINRKNIPRTERSYIKHAPIYIQGPTMPALKVVVQAIRDGPGMMHSRHLSTIDRVICANRAAEISGLQFTLQQANVNHGITTPNLHMNQLILHISCAPGGEPRLPYPRFVHTPLLRYLKEVLLKTLEASGRIKKVRTVRELNQGTEVVSLPDMILVLLCVTKQI